MFLYDPEYLLFRPKDTFHTFTALICALKFCSLSLSLWIEPSLEPKLCSTHNLTDCVFLCKVAFSTSYFVAINFDKFHLLSESVSNNHLQVSCVLLSSPIWLC